MRITPRRKAVWRCERGAPRERILDELAVEEPLEIQVDTRAVSITMRTPGHDEELATGFLLSEGIIGAASQIDAIKPYPRNKHGNAIGVFLKPEVTVDFARLTRHVFASSSCGLCGKTAISFIRSQFPALRPLPKGRVRAETLISLPEKMRRLQSTFDRTGGLHAAALFTLEGELLVLREDVGRHNAVDKVIGWSGLHQRLPLSTSMLMVSGRSSFEIVQKALSVGIPLIASVSAPSSLAVELARSSGQVLVGFLRGSKFNIYTRPSSIES